MEKVSVILPVYNEESNLVPVYEGIKEACGKVNVDYEIIFVDNGSIDNSLNVIKKLRAEDKNVAYLSLSRNFGQQGALFAGMSYSSGAAVITMDADLQHPPALISKMIELWREGIEVVYTIKKGAELNLIKYAAVKIFYRLISKISGLKLNFGQSDFRLLDRKVVDIISGMREYHKFLRGQVSWIGFKQEGLSYDVEKRHSGKSKFSYHNLFSFAFDGIFAFSRQPLHLIMLFGIVVAGTSFFYIFFVLVVWVVTILNISHSWIMPPGWITLSVSVFFLGSIQLIAIGVLGEYIGRIYDQVKERPVFIVRETGGIQRHA